ncbi:RICIN domain-containing protein [Catenulispora sp. MAP12-49]|uniref:RICIN domain-containing protein n=1 Tax=Catenulispora sp. MAP12-49 TaxID=3156302 RepID=UPI0035166A22
MRSSTASRTCAWTTTAASPPRAPVIQWTCTGGTNQHWTVTKQADNLYKIVNVHSGLLLTTASTADGALVTQQTDTGSALQQWSIS